MEETKPLNKFELDVVKQENGLCLSTNTIKVANMLLEKTNVFVIANDSDKKRATEIRAVLNKIIKSIDRTRIDAIEDLTLAFTEQCNQLKELFDKRQKEFGNAIKEYNDSKKAVLGADTEVKKCILTIKTTNQIAVDKITELCKEYGCELSIK